MHYFVVEATPAPDNEQEQGVGGAYVSCWITFALADGAEVLARHYIEQAGWIPGEVREYKVAHQPSTLHETPASRATQSAGAPAAQAERGSRTKNCDA